MIEKDLITTAITPLKPADTAAVALSWMDDLKLCHLPVVEEMEFLGVISEQDIYEMDDYDAPLNSHNLQLLNTYILEDQHVFEAIRMISEQNLTLLPVLDENKKYIGVVTLKSMLDNLALMTSVENPGGIIVLEMSTKDYSVSEIAQIVESNDAKILSLSVTSHTDSTRLEVTIKLNRIDIAGVLQTFDRYQYQVKASYSETSDMDDMRERYDSFMKYLNI